MTYTLEQLEEIAARDAVRVITNSLVEKGVAPEGHDDETRGMFCGALAMSALEWLGIDSNSPEGNRIGPAIVTAALAAFDTGALAERELVSR